MSSRKLPLNALVPVEHLELILPSIVITGKNIYIIEGKFPFHLPFGDL